MGWESKKKIGVGYVRNGLSSAAADPYSRALVAEVVKIADRTK